MFSCFLQLPFLLQMNLTAKVTNSIAKAQLQTGQIQLQKRRIQLQTGRIQLQTGRIQLQKRQIQLQMGRIQLQSCRIQLQKPVLMEMHSRDVTLFIVLLWFNIMDYSSLFQYFLSMCYCPYSSWKLQKNFCVNFFCKW